MAGNEAALPVYVEAGSKKVFAGAIEWPGWARSGRDEAGALEALVAYTPRYERAIGRLAKGLDVDSGAGVSIMERLEGGSGTDFGVPSVPPRADSRDIDDTELDRLTALLAAAWRAFDEAARAAQGVELRKGPRGGGRDVEKMTAHVLDAEKAYLNELGGGGWKGEDSMDAVRRASLDILERRVHGGELPETRRRAPLWLPRYFVRRSAWHALDHAWEIEDRST